jgi:hypothetical protein
MSFRHSNTVKPYDDRGELKFQAESAEELAMVNFARSMGATPANTLCCHFLACSQLFPVGFVKRSQHPTVLEITQHNDAMQPQPQPILEEYNWLATLGFSSARCVVVSGTQQLSLRESTVMIVAVLA